MKISTLFFIIITLILIFTKNKSLKLYKTLKSYSKSPSVITIGTFDGVHLGHQKIINRLIAVANEKQLESVILTFFPHPRMVLQKNIQIKLINTIDERETILSNFDINNLVVKKFTKEFSKLLAHDYVKQILVDGLNAKHIIIGYDHRFGKNRRANIEDLKVFGNEYGFEVEEIAVKDIEDVAVSSTKIRTALLQGDIETANSYLGYTFFITGKIIKGKGIGKKLGFPTANLNIKEHYKLIPKNGVYIVKSKINNKDVFGMMNIGTNPTFNEEKQSIEIHFFDINQNLYKKKLKVEILKRLRDEKKFDAIEDLQSQLQIDQFNSQHYLTSLNE